METVTLSSKFQIVIPKSIRERLARRPSQQFVVVQDGHRIQRVPLEPARKLKGFLKGIETSVPPEVDRL